jgi:hypothetical protein
LCGEDVAADVATADFVITALGLHLAHEDSLPSILDRSLRPVRRDVVRLGVDVTPRKKQLLATVGIMQVIRQDFLGGEGQRTDMASAELEVTFI